MHGLLKLMISPCPFTGLTSMFSQVDTATRPPSLPRGNAQARSRPSFYICLAAPPTGSIFRSPGCPDYLFSLSPGDGVLCQSLWDEVFHTGPDDALFLRLYSDTKPVSSASQIPLLPVLHGPASSRLPTIDPRLLHSSHSSGDAQYLLTPPLPSHSETTTTSRQKTAQVVGNQTEEAGEPANEPKGKQTPLAALGANEDQQVVVRFQLDGNGPDAKTEGKEKSRKRKGKKEASKAGQENPVKTKVSQPAASRQGSAGES
jgi:hypothetical protein